MPGRLGSPRTMRYLRASVLILLFACAGPPAAPPAAPGPGSAPAPEPAAGAPAAGPPLTLRFAYTALSTTIVPYWIAQEAGYFREEGRSEERRVGKEGRREGMWGDE